MKPGWVTEDLNANVRFIDYRGKTPPKRPEGVRLITAKNVKMGVVNETPEEFVDPDAYDAWMTRGFPQKGDVLFTTEAPLGNVALLSTSEKVIIGQRLITMQPEPHLIDNRFLAYSLMSPQLQEEIVSRGTGATVLGIKSKLLKKLPFSYPPLEEQKRIVAVLDAAFEGLTRARTHIETNLQNARELFDEQSRRLLDPQRESWVEHPLSEVCEKITDGTHQTPKYFDDGYVFLSSKNVTSKKIDWNNVKYIDEAQHQAMQKRIAPKRGDILLAKNGTTGVAAMVDRDVVFDIYVSLAHLRPLEVLTSEFLLYFVNSKMAKEQFNSRLKGQGVPNLHLKEIREVIIRFPKNKADQLAIVSSIKELLSETDALEIHYKTKLQDLDDLRQSLLQKAFAGELT